MGWHEPSVLGHHCSVFPIIESWNQEWSWGLILGTLIQDASIPGNVYCCARHTPVRLIFFRWCNCHLIWSVYKKHKVGGNSGELASSAWMAWYQEVLTWLHWLLTQLRQNIASEWSCRHMNCKCRGSQLCISMGISCRYPSTSNNSGLKWLFANISQCSVVSWISWQAVHEKLQLFHIDMKMKEN